MNFRFIKEFLKLGHTFLYDKDEEYSIEQFYVGFDQDGNLVTEDEDGFHSWEESDIENWTFRTVEVPKIVQKMTHAQIYELFSSREIK